MRVDIDLIKLKLKEMLGEERLEHSVNTSKIARKLAMKYDYDIDKAEVAGLLHDCAKDLDYKIYLSDKIEPLRNMNGVEGIRKMAEIDLDRAALMALDKGLLYLISKN